MKKYGILIRWAFLSALFPFLLLSCGDGLSIREALSDIVSTYEYENGPSAEIPVFSPDSGTHSSDITVSLSTETEGASIYYTTDGTDPAAESTLYEEPIAVKGDGASLTIKAFAFLEGIKPSAVAEGVFTIDYAPAATPAFSPSPGTYGADIDVTISSAASGASIYYTTDGSAPTSGSTPYTAQIPVAGDGTNLTIKAIALIDGMKPSAVAEGNYIIDYSAQTYPEISVRQGSTPISSGSYTENFGTVYADLITTTGSLLIPFTIENEGDGNLDISSIDISGTGSSAFLLDDSSTSSTVGPSGSTNFYIRFTPQTEGAKSAALTISNNDSDEGSFTFALEGTGVEDAVTTDTYAFAAGYHYSAATDEVKTHIIFCNSLDGVPVEGLNSTNFRVEESINSGPWQSIAQEDITLTTAADTGEQKSVHFMFDQSGSVSGMEFDLIKNYLTNYFVPEMDDIDTGSGSYWSTAHMPFDIQFSQVSVSGNALTTTIMSLPWQGSGTSIIFDSVFNVLDHHLSSAPADALNTIILFCDGPNGTGTNTFGDCVLRSTNYHIPIYLILWDQNPTYLSGEDPLDFATSRFYTYQGPGDVNPTYLETVLLEAENHMDKTYVLYWDTTGTSTDSVDVRIYVDHGNSTQTWTEELNYSPYTVN